MIITFTFHQFPGGSDSKESTCNAGDLGSIPGWKDSLENGMATLSSLLSWRIPWTKEPDSLWGHKESNMTEQLTISFPFQTLFTVYGYQLLPKPPVVVAVVSELNVAQSCPTLCNPRDSSRPGSSVYGILQARILEWVAISFSKLLVHLIKYFVSLYFQAHDRIVLPRPREAGCNHMTSFK